jgi:hypothetical protein
MAEDSRDAEKVEAKERPKKPPGYRKFEKLLKQVIKAPPMRKHS